MRVSDTITVENSAHGRTMMYTVQLPWKDWVITGELGRGASGTVYLAEKDVAGEKIQSAIKIITISSGDSDETEQDIMREIRIMEQMKGLSNIVSIEDVEMEGSLSSGCKVYIRMEYLQPFPEWKKLHLPQPVTDEFIVRLGTDICKALDECEKKGIVHRDIKPANIFVSDHGHFKLGDFSISRELDKKRIRQTNSGTELYIAPETERQYCYDARSDIYSLGLVLYELGNNNRMPFETTNQQQAIQRRLAGEPIEKDPEMVSNHALAETIKKAIRFRPEERYQNAASFSRELSRSISGKQNAKAKQRQKQNTPVLRIAEGIEKTPEQEERVRAACFRYVSGTLNNEAGFLRVAAEVLFAGENCWPDILSGALKTENRTFPPLKRYAFLTTCREKGLFCSKNMQNSLTEAITETEGVCSYNLKAALAKKMIDGTETEEEANILDRILKKTSDDRIEAILKQIPKEKLKEKEYVHEVIRLADLTCLFSMMNNRTVIDNAIFDKRVKVKYPGFANASEWFGLFEKNRGLRNTYSHQDESNIIASMAEANNILQPMFDLCMKLKNPGTEKALAEFAERTVSLNDQEDLGFYDVHELTGFDQDEDIQCILNIAKKYIGEEALDTPGYLFCNSQCAGLVSALAINQSNDSESSAESLERDLQEMLQELPPVSSLLRLSLPSAGAPLSAVLSEQQVRELCRTHHILLDKSVLMSSDGRDLINELAKQIPDGRKILVTTTTRYLLHPEDSTESNREGRAGYIQLKAMQASGKAAVIGKEPEISSKDDLEAVEIILRTNDRIRMCVITNNYSAALKAIDVKKYPYLLIGKCSPAMLPGEKTGIKAFGQCLPVKERRIKETVTVSPELPDRERTVSEQNTHPFFAFGRNAGHQKTEAADKHPAGKTEQAVLPAHEAASGKPDNKKNVKEPMKAELLEKQNAKVHASAAAPDKQVIHERNKQDEKNTGETDNDIAGKKLYDAEHDAIVLKSKIAGGGEGTIWETSKGKLLAKIYHQKYLTENPVIEKKLKAMAGNWPVDHHICSPQAFLYDETGKFRGFLMRRVPERFLELQTSVLKISIPNVRQKILPGWTRTDLVQTTRAIALLLSRLHEKGFLMGDINPRNIMIDPGNSRDVYLVDCDSYQFGEYPCPVGMEEYDHPQLSQNSKGGNLNYSKIHRKPEHENYSFAILAFQILFCGSYPFENIDSSSPQECTREKKFMYGENWQDTVFENNVIWQQLPKELHILFSDTFRKWETADMKKWAEELGRYSSMIRMSREEGSSLNFSDELMPPKFREFHSGDDPYFRDGLCRACGREFNYPRMYKGRIGYEKLFCPSCKPIMDRQQALICDGCGKTFTGQYKQTVLKTKEGKEILCPECLRAEAEMVESECAVCKKRIREHRDIAAGVRKYNDNRYICPDDRYICENCGKPTYLAKDSPKIEELHKNRKKVLCKICNNSARGKQGGNEQ